MISNIDDVSALPHTDDGLITIMPAMGAPLTEQINAKIVLLTHYIPLYQVRVFQQWASSVRELKILLSTPIEPNRDFKIDWSGLAVEVQSSVTLRRRWRHQSAGFEDPLFVHVPYDTGRRLKAERPDVVVSHELGARSTSAARYARRSGAKLVLATFMSEHTEQGRGFLRRRLRERLVSQADAITYNGPSCRRYLLSLGAKEERMFHWPYAADDRHFHDPGPQSDTPLPPRKKLICIGQLSQRKGVLPMLQQLNEYVQSSGRSIELTLVGDGPLRGELESLLAGGRTDQFPRSLHPQLKVELLGIRAADSLPSLMLQHAAAIAPTLADEWLLVVDESMHLGLPVIGSVYAQAVTTLIQPKINGWQYDPLCGGTKGLANTLNDYFRMSDDQYRSVCQAAKHSVMHRTPEFSASGILAAVRAALQAPEKG